MHDQLFQEASSSTCEKHLKHFDGRCSTAWSCDGTHSACSIASKCTRPRHTHTKLTSGHAITDVFQIPPWIAYILRTFTVLEGVGLSQDPNYSITQECYPFLARRLFTDNSPRAQNALRQMLYGTQTDEHSFPRLNVRRLQDLSKGFQSYTVTTTAVERSQGFDNAANQVVEILLAPEGNFVQQVVIEELVAALDAGECGFLRWFVESVFVLCFLLCVFQ